MIHLILFCIFVVIYISIGVGFGFILKDVFHVESIFTKIIAVFFWPVILVIGFVYGTIKLIRYVLEK